MLFTCKQQQQQQLPILPVPSSSQLISTQLSSSQPYYLQTLDERGLLSTYICPCPSVEIQVVVVAGPAGVLAEEPRLYQIDGTESVDCEWEKRSQL